jgi:hypothetical protein
LILSQHGRGRVAYMPADVDRRYALEHLPDHATLLANLIRWASADAIPLGVEGTGLVDCHLFEQPGRMILHLVNLTSEASWRAPLNELIKVGPFRVTVRLAKGLTPRSARLLVAGGTVPLRRDNAFAVFTVDAILDHEVVVVE